MDHLMPEMDGIECLEALREQAGGLNRNTPVIVLTANAGSENRDLYNQAGFDGYLVKPVSGEAMEEMLIRHISQEKIILRSVMMGRMRRSIPLTGMRKSSGHHYRIQHVRSSGFRDQKAPYPIIPFVIKDG